MRAVEGKTSSMTGLRTTIEERTQKYHEFPIGLDAWDTQLGRRLLEGSEALSVSEPKILNSPVHNP